MELKEKITWFNRWYHILKNRKYYYADDEELLQFVIDHYMNERDRSEFKYEDVWDVVRNNQNFM